MLSTLVSVGRRVVDRKVIRQVLRAIAFVTRLGSGHLVGSSIILIVEVPHLEVLMVD
jgi:hypothetical protein